jgi:hypothetical protein
MGKELLVVHPNRRRLVLEVCCGVVGAVIGAGILAVPLLWEVPNSGMVLGIGWLALCLCVGGTGVMLSRLRHRGPLLVIGERPRGKDTIVPEGFIAADEIEAIILYRLHGGSVLGFRLRDPTAVLARIPRSMSAFFCSGPHPEVVSFCLSSQVLPMSAAALGREIHERFGVSRGIAPDATIDLMS